MHCSVVAWVVARALLSVLAHSLSVLVEINEGICHYISDFFRQCSNAAHINMKNRSVTIVS